MFDEETIEGLKKTLKNYKKEQLYVLFSYLRWYQYGNKPKQLVDILYTTFKSPIVNVKIIKNISMTLNVHKDTLKEIDNSEKAFITLIKQSQIK